MLNDSTAIYSDYNVDVSSATTSEIITILIINQTDLTTEELIELIDTNLVIYIEEHDDEVNFIVSQVTVEVVTSTENNVTDDGDNNNNSDDLSTFAIIGIIFGVLLCIVISWFSIDSMIKKRKSSRNGVINTLINGGEMDTTSGATGATNGNGNTTADTLEMGQTDGTINNNGQANGVDVNIVLPQQPQVKTMMGATPGEENEANDQNNGNGGDAVFSKPVQAETGGRGEGEHTGRDQGLSLASSE